MDLGRVQAELDALAARIGHGLSVDDPQGRIVAYSVQDTDADTARITSILSRRVSPEIQEWQNRHGIAEATEPVRVPANPALGMAPRVCVPIRRGEGLLGHLWVLEPGEPLDDTALVAVVRCADDLVDALGSGLGSRPGEDVDALVRRLLDGASGPEVCDRLAEAVPALLGARVRICAAVPYRPGTEAVTVLTAAEFRRLSTSLSRSLRSRPGYVGSHAEADHAVVLFRHRPEGRTPSLRETLEEIGRAVDRGTASAGVAFAVGAAEPVPFDADAVREAHAQALAAAELAVLDPALPKLLSWSDLGPYRSLLRTAPPPTDEALAPLTRTAGSARMLEYTLETYLDLGCDAQRTAERLRLHRTSLYYRLGRIADILGVDLGDGLVRLELHLALKSRRLARRTLA